jgi:hypothetical protein
MELTLNLFWLLLTVPALWLWWDARLAENRTGRQSKPSLLILGCLLLLLFPVVSATDDLQAMRPEIEESGTSDGARNSRDGRVSAHPDHSSNTTAVLVARFYLQPLSAVRAVMPQMPVARAFTVSATAHAERAPPAALLS